MIKSKTVWTVSLIIPVFNNKELLRKNLPSVLEAKKNKTNRIIEIIIIDDGSSDGSYDVVKKEFPGIKLVKHSQNRGFSSAVNTGARAAKGGLLVLLNSDVVPTANFLKSVFANFENPSVFAVSLHEEGFGPANGFFRDGYIGHSKGEELQKVHETFWVSAGSGVYRRDYWMKLGGMDEKLLSPFYKEDLDISYRASKRGLINLWDPSGVVFHNHESTISKLSKKFVNRIIERNELLVHWKNITSQNLFRRHIFGMTKRLLSHPGYTLIILMALKKLSLVLKLRRKEIRETKISDEAIFAKFQNA